MNRLINNPCLAKRWIHLFLLLGPTVLFACAHKPPPAVSTVLERWVNQPIQSLIDRIGPPDNAVSWPDGTVQYTYFFREKKVFADIFQGEMNPDMSTIRVQEDLALEARIFCRLELLVQNGRIKSLEISGRACGDTQDRLLPQ